MKSYFSGKLTPKPVITTRGICFALNTRKMEDVFEKSDFTDSFEAAFDDQSIKGEILSGRVDSIELDIDMHAKYLTELETTERNFL